MNENELDQRLEHLTAGVETHLPPVQEVRQRGDWLATRRRRIRRATVSVAVALPVLLLAVVLLRPQSSDSDRFTLDVAEQPDAPADDPGVTLPSAPEAQLCPEPPPALPEPPTGEAINRQLLMSLFSDDLESTFGARWGGWLIDHRRDGLYIIRLVDPTPEDDEIVAGFLGEELPYEIEATPWSMGELHRQIGAVMALREQLEADGYEVANSGIATLHGPNRVEVNLLGSPDDPDTARLAAFYQRILELDPSLDAICVKRGPGVELLAPNWDDQQP